MLKAKKKVLVLMSGGVDSSVAAALLKKQANPHEFKKLMGRPAPKGFRGYDVSGVYLKLWETKRSRTPGAPGVRLLTETGDPCWAHDKRDAEKVAAKLDIPFFVLDVTREYQKRVMNYFIREYASGRTPNPDVMCNKEIKFGFVLEKALSLGFDYVATGHYARLRREFPISNFQFPNKFKIQNSKFQVNLLQAKDKNKDQSYFLWTLTQKQLARILFPLGNLTKPQARQLAKKFGLPVWNKKDSQGICFLGKIKVKDFLQRKIKSHPGKIVNLQGKILGEHPGVNFFTIGQRAGLKIGGRGPYFVYQKNLKKNLLTVVSGQEKKLLLARQADLEKIHWINNQPLLNQTLLIRPRYRAPLIPGKIIRLPSKKETYRIILNKPARALTSGQSAVFYKKNQCLGGGVIR